MSDNEYSDSDKIERLQKSLYSRKPLAPNFSMGHGVLSEKKNMVPSDWKDSNLNLSEETKEKTGMSLFLKIFLVSVVFFAFSVGVGVFVFFGGSNNISSENIQLSVVGPAAVSSGDELSLDVLVNNKNSIDMEFVDLTFKFPEGTKAAGNINQDFSTYRIDIGNLPTGQEIRRNVKALIFGTENSEQNILVSIDYRIKGSNAIFHKEEIYKILISSSPVVVKVDAVTETTSNQEIEIKLDVSSNSNAAVKDVLLTASYPPGFSFRTSAPKTMEDNNIWKLGDIEPNGKRQISIKGILVGQNMEDKIFKFAIGAQSSADPSKIAAAFSSYEHNIVISKPFLAVTVKFEDDNFESSGIAKNGKILRGTIEWQNNLPVKITDAEINMVLAGEALDKSTVGAQGGFYNSSLNTITWTKETMDKLSEIAAGASGSANFSFSSVSLSTMQTENLRNPEISYDVSVSGKRVSEKNVPEEATSATKGSVKFASNLSILAKAIRYSGPFQNTGPIPPKAGEESTYTVVWTISNTSNPLTGVKVSASLPSYMRWVSRVSPVGENISYNSENRSIVWDVGDVKPGTGFTIPSKEVYFQVAIIPSISQYGSAPVILNQTFVNGVDRFTNLNLPSSVDVLTTKLPYDTEFKTQDDIVVK